MPALAEDWSCQTWHRALAAGIQVIEGEFGHLYISGPHNTEALARLIRAAPAGTIHALLADGCQCSARKAGKGMAYVQWPGTHAEGMDLVRAISRNCACVFGAMGMRQQTCEPHRALLEDLRWLKGLLFMRRLLAERAPGAGQRVIVRQTPGQGDRG